MRKIYSSLLTFCLWTLFNVHTTQAQIAITLDVQSAVPDDYFGFNATNLIRPGSPNFDTQWLIDSVETLGTNIVRYPGGTIANYWDWQSGYFDNDMPKGWILPKDFNDNVYRNMDMFKLKTMVDRMGVPPILTVNLLTKDKYNAAAGVMFANGLNLSPKYVELGNEIYLDYPSYEKRFPTVEDYIAECNQWASYIKGKPGLGTTKISVVGSTDRYPAEPLVSRKNRWTGIVASNANQYIDAITLHHYVGTALGTSKSIENNIGLALSNAFNGFDELLPELTDIGNAGKEAWITEYNLFERKKCVNEGFFHGLFTSAMTLSMLQSPVITKLICHSMVGSVETSAILGDSEDLDIGSSYDNNVNCLPNPVPEANSHEKTGMGSCLELVGTALKNAEVKRKLIFANSPKLTSNYDALFGYWFDGKLSTEMVILNLDSSDRTVTIAKSVFDLTNGKYVMISPGPGGVLELIKGAAKTNPGVYECKTSGTQNASQTLVLKKYSVTRVYVTKGNVKVILNDKIICSGSSTTVLAKGGSGYTWNNGSLVPVKTNNSVMNFIAPVVTVPTNYKLKVTTAQGYSDSVTITVNPKPVLTVTASTTQACKGTAVNLSATLTGGNSANTKTFIWYPSQYIANPDLANTVAYPVKETVFRCYASDGVCFSVYDSVPKITVVPNADAGKNISICDDSLPAKITALQVNGSASYKWYDEAGILMETGPNALVSPIATSKYMLVVTATGNSCKDTAYVSVSTFTCCQSTDAPAQLTFAPGDNLSVNFIPKLMAFCQANPGHGYCTEDTLMNFNDEILFNGDFFIDQDFTFINCSKIHFAEKARLNFTYGLSKLSFKNCTLEASICSNRMWNGFYMVDFGSTVVLDNCKVNDCEIIVEGYLDPALYFSNTKFDRFYQGIYLSESSYNQQGWFYGNTFSQTATLKYPHSGKKSLYAFKLDNYQTTQIGDTLFAKNTFNNLQYGIISINSNLNLFNSKFINISSWDSSDSTNGTAVLLMNTMGYGNPNNPEHLWPELFFKSGAEFNAKPNKFEDCTNGVYAINARVEIKSNVFKNTSNAISLIGLTSKNTFLNRNVITGADVGIDLIEPKLCSVNITNNTVSTNSQLFGNKVTPGIRVLDAFSQPCNLILKSNVVNSGGTHGYYFVNGMTDFNFTDNKIYLTNPLATFTSYGVRFENMDFVNYKCNLSKGTDGTSMLNKTNVSFVSCPNAVVQCNTFDFANYGVEFLGNCNNLALKNNDFNFLNDGLVIGAIGQTGGVIGPQPSSYTGGPVRNMFNGMGVSKVNGPNKKKGIFGHAATYVINSQCAGGKASPQQFFAQYNDSLTVPYPNLKFGSNATAFTPYLQTKVGTPCTVNCLQPNPKRIANPNLVQSSHDVDNDDEEGAAMDFENTINEILPNISDEALLWNVKSQLYTDLDMDTAKMEGNSNLTDFYNVVGTGNIAQIINLNNLMKNMGGDNVSALQYKLNLAKAIEMNNDFVPSNLIEKTYKDFNTLYLNSNSNNNYLPANDIKALSVIAHRCPYIYGNAVFNARVMYAQYSRFENYDDAVICKGKYQINESESARLSSEDVRVGLYPNPNDGQFNLSYDLTDFSNASISFYDVLGKEVAAQNLNVNSDRSTINLQNLNEGIYTYKVIANGRQINFGKVSIIR